MAIDGFRADPESFLNYCTNHCQTPRHIFHKEHVALLLEFAGSPRDYDSPSKIRKGRQDFYSLTGEYVHPLVEMVRKRLEDKSLLPEKIEIAS